MAERLQKILSQWGIASRRQAEQSIRDGRVRVNGIVAKLGQTADLDTDRIEVDDKLISVENKPRPVYLLLNKPLGVVSTCSDPQGRSTVLDLLSPDLRESEGIHPVGRLDIDSTGALLLTNDGELTFYLTHPRHSISKTYVVWVQSMPSNAALAAWRRGIVLDGQRTLPAQVEVVKRKPDRTLLKIILTEGRNRQIRRIADILGHPVIHLHRTKIGSISLEQGDPLPIGCYRHLDPKEILSLQTTDVNFREL
jgi:23S rRNA pseudouridine2605 synthase